MAFQHTCEVCGREMPLRETGRGRQAERHPACGELANNEARYWRSAQAVIASLETDEQRVAFARKLRSSNASELNATLNSLVKRKAK